MSDKKRWLSVIGRFFLDLFTKNIPLKIIALLFAFLLWAYVLTIENPVYPKVVRNVEITMVGEESLTERGLMLVSRDLGTADVTVQCAIGKHSELDATRISCVVDLNNRRLNLTEDEDSKEIALTVQTTLESGFGTITSVSNGTVNVQLLCEKLGGGGHFAMAAASFNNGTIALVESRLLDTLDTYLNQAKADIGGNKE